MRRWALAFVFLATLTAPAAAEPGQIHAVWADPLRPGLKAEKLLFLTTEGGRTIPLGPASAGQAGFPEAASKSGQPGVARWISLLCKFADQPEEEHGTAYYAGMYGPGRDRIQDIWLDQSYGALRIEGQGAVGWLTLPHPREHYVPPDASIRLGPLGDDCVAAADPFVDFSQVEGINMFFNADLGGFIYGGGYLMKRDGLHRVIVGATYLTAGVGLPAVAHEMGHSFGLPHSNNSDQDADPYDNAWDVMSWSWAFVRPEPTYGSVGSHTNAYHKDLLGWIPPERKLDVFCGEQRVGLGSLALPEAQAYRLARIHLPDQSRFYNLEVRGSGYYDAPIAAAGISGRRLIVYEVKAARAEPAWVVDKNQPPSDFAMETAGWSVGETWHDPSGSFSVRVVATTSDGLEVEIDGPPCAESRFDVEVEWKDSQGNRGTATAVPFGMGDSKLLWFFSPENWEMMVKVLDGCALNGHFWVFAAATTNVEYTLRVTDTRTGATKSYFKELGPPAPAITDTAALPCAGASFAVESTIVAASAADGLIVTEDPIRMIGPCNPGGGSLCLENRRFEVRAFGLDFDRNFFWGSRVPLQAGSSGVFWFFGPGNWELMVKVLNGCGLNQRFWVFAAATTNVEYTFSVRDTVTGVTRYYLNPRGQVSPATTDTSAFAGCP